jgi:hypothetical protein
MPGREEYDTTVRRLREGLSNLRREAEAWKPDPLAALAKAREIVREVTAM